MTQASTFAYESRSFTNKEISSFMMSTTVDTTITHYVSRIEKVFLHKSGALHTDDITKRTLRHFPLKDGINIEAIRTIRDVYDDLC